MAINTIKPPTATPRANVPRAVVAPEPEPVRLPEPEMPRAPRPQRPRSNWSVFTLLERLTSMDGLFRDGLPVRYLPHVLFIMFLVLVYIGNTHYAYRMNRNIQKLKLETEDLRADYTTLKSDYMEASKQSEVARKVASYGLVESSSPPFHISVPAGRLDEAALDRVPLLTADSVAAQAARAKADSVAASAAPETLEEGEAPEAPPIGDPATLETPAAAKPAAPRRKPMTLNPSTHSAKRGHERKR
ncbi:FtsL-like putative cell division protein [Hymenobacter sp. BT491]|uniref:FtsL-like putative cell division protein n=1 Tax=Hymenobacter sp. BT491 TaxID=2766779 RepID=UPI001653C6DB|nr:FtsL-like putative cell division protein [Hymenobacter sp. BT491]MBC6988606.1 hypothetical protein [Hymenobacter sp. BT491]